MSTYTPKIVISNYSNINKVRFENAHGELQMMIEKDLGSQDNKTEDESESYLNTTQSTITYR